MQKIIFILLVGTCFASDKQNNNNNNNQNYRKVILNDSFLSFNTQLISDEEAAKSRAKKDCKEATKSMRNRDKKS